MQALVVLTFADLALVAPPREHLASTRPPVAIEPFRATSTGVTLKCIPHEKYARGDIITELMSLPY